MPPFLVKEPAHVDGNLLLIVALVAPCARPSRSNMGSRMNSAGKPLALMTAVMAFDPGSEQKVWVWVASFAILSIPLWFVVGAVLGWVLHLRGSLRGSLVAVSVPLVAVGVGLRAVC
jgi:hypothetical protein